MSNRKEVRRAKSAYRKHMSSKPVIPSIGKFDAKSHIYAVDLWLVEKERLERILKSLGITPANVVTPLLERDGEKHVDIIHPKWDNVLTHPISTETSEYISGLVVSLIIAAFGFMSVMEILRH